jgi:hypothetical protein
VLTSDVGGLAWAVSPVSARSATTVRSLRWMVEPRFFIGIFKVTLAVGVGIGALVRQCTEAIPSSFQHGRQDVLGLQNQA